MDLCDDSCITVGDLGEGSGIAPSTVSHHLKELYRSGLIQMERQGQQVKCWVESSVLQELSEFFTDHQIDSE